MKTCVFNSLLDQLDQLTVLQRDLLATALLHPASTAEVLDVIEHRGEHHSSPQHCPRCTNSHIVRWGVDKGLQRYMCKQCHRTFNALTGTPLAHLRLRENWLDYANSLIEGQSVRKAAIKCGIHRTTSFRWRHRFLKQSCERKDVEFQGIVEADETFFLESFKGQRQLPRPARQRGGKAAKRGLSSEQIPVLIVRDRHGATTDGLLPNLGSEAIGAVLCPLLHPDTVLCSDGASAYKTIARKHHIEHQPINVSAGEKVKAHAFHIQNVNAYDSRLKGWMFRFHGVATRYLPSYLGWHRMLDKWRSNLDPRTCLEFAVS